MTEARQIIFQDGTEAGDLASFASTTTKILDIFTDKQSDVGTRRTIIRTCNSLNQLLEMNLYIEVLANSHPVFESTLQTSFVVHFDEVRSFTLPKLVDKEGNDQPVLTVEAAKGMENKYPTFMTYTSSSRRIRFDPDSKESLAGKTYYFNIVAKEKNSDLMKKEYSATVRITGNNSDLEQLYDSKRVRGTLVSYQILAVD